LRRLRVLSAKEWTLQGPHTARERENVMATNVKQMLEAANAAVPRITPAQARDLIAKENTLVVDVRDAPEVAASGSVADTSTGHFQDAELDAFVDALARRISSFDRRAIDAAKNLVNQVSLPSADRLLDAITSFETALTWPETQQRVQALLRLGLQQDVEFEKRWPDNLGTLLDV
jgi:hypothetical protein